MTARWWLSKLPSTDAAFTALHRAAELAPPEDFPRLELAHQQAVADAKFGKDPAVLDERATELHEYALRLAARYKGDPDQRPVHSAELEALGYALGVTAARYAIRVHDQAQAGIAVAA